MIDRLVRFTSAALLCGTMAGAAQAQSEVYSSGNLNNNETFSGGNTSNPTGTQGAVGNPFCAPPHEVIDCKDVTPLNWSCPTVQQPYVIPPNMAVARPGPTYQPGAANPCQPGGPGGYNYLNNPVGTQLPPGCARPTTGGGDGVADSQTKSRTPTPGGPTGKQKSVATDVKLQPAKPTADPGLPSTGTAWGPNSTKIDANHIRVKSPNTGTQYDLEITRSIEVPGPEAHDKPVQEKGILQKFGFSDMRPEYAWGVYKGPSEVNVIESGTVSNK